METENHNQLPSAGAADVPVTRGEEPTPANSTPWRNLLANLRSGLRLAVFLRVTAEELRATPGDLALLAAADLVLNLAVSFLIVGDGGSFAFAALPSFFFHLPLMLLLGLLAARLLACPRHVTVIPVALIALSIPLELCHGALEAVTRLPWLARLEGEFTASHYYRFFGWWTVAAFLFLARLAPAAPLRRAALVLLFLACLATPLWYFPRGDLWLGASGGPESGELRLTEEVLSVQQRLLDEQLARLLPGKKGTPHLYFAGFAGDATQDVFTRELLAAEKLFTERFGAAGRAIALANNPQTATTLPFATATNLERSITRIGRVMDRDEDVLFLFLSSHGSADHVLEVNNGPLELDGLTPEMVRRMLANSGIKWKVIVVSACYGGGFIAPLKDDRTLIVTAADATHESFGCSYGEKFTWFGRAYFDEALRRTRSFTTAFDRARETISKWEEREGETPSNPQIWVGKEIEGKLAALEKRLAAGGID
jgi:Peptidase C13 family